LVKAAVRKDRGNRTDHRCRSEERLPAEYERYPGHQRVKTDPEGQQD
jgi:hypothetical protein